MPNSTQDSEEDKRLPMRGQLQEQFHAQVITYENNGERCAGGMCSCCGCGPNIDPDYRAEPWYIYQANICDADGVFYSMACEDCLEVLRHERHSRQETTRDLMAEEIGKLLGDDVDGAQSMMDDFEGLEFD